MQTVTLTQATFLILGPGAITLTGYFLLAFIKAWRTIDLIPLYGPRLDIGLMLSARTLKKVYSRPTMPRFVIKWRKGLRRCPSPNTYNL